MNDRYLFKAKDCNSIWRIGLLVSLQGTRCVINERDGYGWTCDSETLCQCTGLKDRNGNLIWENDVLMCNGNPKDLVKAVFGEFSVINADTLERIDRVIGWHYEVIPTDALSKCEPFCLSMPLTEFYIDRCNMKIIGSIIDNHPELLEVE